MVEPTHEQTIWWGSFSLAEGQGGRWQVGPSTVWISRSAQEWRVVHLQHGDPFESTVQISVPLPEEEAIVSLDDLDPKAAISRYSFRKTDTHLLVMPALADRAIVIRPDKPLYVPAGEEVTLYISTPLWICIEVGEPARLLQEIPSYRASDTWFGASTLDGELCYASRTTARLLLQDVPPRFHRALTPILIHNEAEDALLLERIRLPVQHLSLFQAANDFLWTERVTLDRERSGEQAALHLGAGAPPEAARARLIRPPRHPLRTNVIVRAFSSFFHKITES